MNDFPRIINPNDLCMVLADPNDCSVPTHRNAKGSMALSNTRDMPKALMPRDVATKAAESLAARLGKRFYVLKAVVCVEPVKQTITTVIE